MSYIEESLYKMDWGYDEQTKKQIYQALYYEDIKNVRCLFSFFEKGLSIIKKDSAITSPASWSSSSSISKSSSSSKSFEEMDEAESTYDILFAYDNSSKKYGMKNFKGNPIYYNKSIYSRIHGFIIVKVGGCLEDAVNKVVYDKGNKTLEKPTITQLVLVCSSSKSIYKGVGSLLISTYLFISQYLRYDISILEVANDLEEEDDSKKYGDKAFKKGKNQKKDLYCFYERMGYKEDPIIHKPWECFSEEDPLPTMYLDLKKYSRKCLSQAFLNRMRPDKASSFCSSKKVKFETSCKRTRQKDIVLETDPEFKP